MKKDHRQGVLNAMNKFSSRVEKERQRELGIGRKNDKPEKRLQTDALHWMRTKGWSVNVFEAKSTYDPSRGRYISQSMKAGTLDIGGSTSEGIACVIELKAPGKLSTLRDNQRKTLHEKINSNNFACVVDSVHRLETMYTEWRRLRDLGDAAGARAYLVSMIPPESKSGLESEELFPEE